MDFIAKLDKHNNDYCTPPETWHTIAEYLPKGYGVEVCESFYNADSTSAATLRDLGCKVVCEDVDFFNHKLGTHIVTNPPFSCKEAVFNRLAELDMPFIVLIPSHSMCARYIKRHFKNKLQIIIPNTRLHYMKKDKETGERFTLKRTPFDSVYMCYKMGLPRDVIWL
jgi:predicted RNA methylase